MSSKLNKELEAALVNRPRPNLKNDVASTIIGLAGRESSAPVMLPLSQLVRSRFQSRGKRDEEYMENLVESIRQEGLLDPVIVRPLPVEQAEQSGHTMSTLPLYELVAGHHRVDAFKILGRNEIPATVRVLTDAEAARALTSENTTRKGLGDWELYKHMQMLYAVGAVTSQRTAARVLNVSRAVVQALEAFALLPQSVHELLDDHPGLVGYNLADDLRPYCAEHALLVFDALCLLAKKKLTQAAVPRWIEDKATPQARKPRKELELGNGVRLIVNGAGARVSGKLDYDRLHRLIEANLPALLLAD
jgi:ParB family chromosome partitioning protein